MTTDYLADLDAYVETARPQFERELANLVNIPTVSADPDHQADIQKGAAMAVSLLTEAGFSAEMVTTAGNPVVFGQLVHDPTYPTVTIYNHLDVQPADPGDWQTEPFHLTIADGRYAGRGATDDKGPALTALTAIRYARQHRLPLNFKIVWELEEEIGSPHFEDFVKKMGNQLVTDSVVVSDTIWISAGKPAIPAGLRGMMTFEISLRTSEADTHSGLTGGAARNPIGELAQIISECYEATTGRVKIPGFYDDVKAATAKELDDFVASGFTVEGFKSDHGLRSIRTEDVKEVLARIMAEPTFEVHGIVGGYVGPGIKAIVPPQATAKLSTRLVPNQDPHKVFALVKEFILARHPDVEVTIEGALEPYLAELGGPYAQAASSAMQFAFGAKPAFVREGGSIGAVITMKKYLKAPIMLLGLSLPEQGYHAPNEYYDWQQASGGIKMYVKYFEEIATLPTNR